MLGAIVVFALIAPLIGDPNATPADGLSKTGLPLGMFSDGHLLGTDRLGRDMLTRAAYGARASLEIAFLANIASVGLGVIVGLVAGFYRAGSSTC
jgi:peptide/nickel transport system permease protein